MAGKQELIELNNIEDGTVFLEPHEVFGKGIVGVSEDRCHLIYDYQKTADALADSYEAEWKEMFLTNEGAPDFLMEAYEWLDYNTLAECYPEGKEPIFIFPLIVDI